LSAKSKIRMGRQLGEIWKDRPCATRVEQAGCGRSEQNALHAARIRRLAEKASQQFWKMTR
jgi:hypothetical protein